MLSSAQELAKKRLGARYIIDPVMLEVVYLPRSTLRFVFAKIDIKSDIAMRNSKELCPYPVCDEQRNPNRGLQQDQANHTSSLSVQSHCEFRSPVDADSQKKKPVNTQSG